MHLEILERCLSLPTEDAVYAGETDTILQERHREPHVLEGLLHRCDCRTLVTALENSVAFQNCVEGRVRRKTLMLYGLLLTRS